MDTGFYCMHYKFYYIPDSMSHVSITFNVLACWQHPWKVVISKLQKFETLKFYKAVLKYWKDGVAMSF